MIAQADCFRIPLASKSVHCVVTSPPYWGLRKYAGEQGQEPLGLEPTPERHIERTVEWAREVYRVLRDDGVFWLNYGDSYSGSGGENGNSGLGLDTAEAHGNYRKNPRKKTVAGGNLTMMPHRVALALQQDGWIVRQDLVWSKPNPMPESVRGWAWQRKRKMQSETRRPAEHPMPGKMAQRAHDGRDFAQPEYEYGPDYELRRGSWRHTRGHEYVFMLTKQMQYFSDQEAVRETNTPGTIQRLGSGPVQASGKNKKNIDIQRWAGQQDYEISSGRNPRSVLHIPTAPYKGAHYATYPPALIAPLILATCPRWCCPVCGQGWAPVVEQRPNPDGIQGAGKHRESERDGGLTDRTRNYETEQTIGMSNVLGHRPTCDHPHTQAEAVPGIVFDPFVGSGTSVMVANQVGRRGIGTDISGPYLREQAQMRIVVPPTGKWAKQLAKLRKDALAFVQQEPSDPSPS